MTLPIAIRCEGEFQMRTPDTPNKCGPGGLRTFRYEARLCTTEAHLDHRGFIVDGLAVHDYFVTTLASTEPFPSCELLTLRAVRDLRAMAPECDRIEVKIWNGIGAYMESHWERPADRTVVPGDRVLLDPHHSHGKWFPQLVD